MYQPHPADRAAHPEPAPRRRARERASAATVDNSLARIDATNDRPLSERPAPRWTDEDRALMQVALDEARAAAAEDEVPVGAVVVRLGRIAARAHNRVRQSGDPTAHAELLALRAAAAELGAARLPECALYVTLEPCFMCAGALVHARVARVCFAARDPKFGACVSLGSVLSDPRANHRAELAEGLFADESAEILRSFFRAKRAPRKAGES